MCLKKCKGIAAFLNGWCSHCLSKHTLSDTHCVSHLWSQLSVQEQQDCSLWQHADSHLSSCLSAGDAVKCCPIVSLRRHPKLVFLFLYLQSTFPQSTELILWLHHLIPALDLFRSHTQLASVFLKYFFSSSPINKAVVLHVAWFSRFLAFFSSLPPSLPFSLFLSATSRT